MKKTILNTIFTLLTITVMLINLFFLITDNTAYSLDSLPTGTHYASDGADTPYYVSIYIIDAGKSFGKAVRAEATERESGKTYNVYWETGISQDPTYKRISDSEMEINGHVISLEPNGVHYDSRTADLSPTLFNN